jgi:hypothetical protein
MKKVATARVKWLSAGQGGRSRPPSGGKYSTTVQFEGEPTHDSGVMWSLVVDVSAAAEGSTEVIVPVWLLAHDKPDAPNHLLVPGSRFRLLEGRRVVAEGEVVD